ncbi:MAG: ribosome assembly RNA-binding protein YhbY [Candidatus Hydrogenedentes bacterium]|nr:ribosome assembly RNA-binding protein YhbY [Candidatus Hydrogenedentota bacterium]
MTQLNSQQRRYLRSLAHHLEPSVYVGKQGITDPVVQSVAEALAAHELIKVRFVDRKDEKKELTEELASRSDSAIAGIIGNIAILYRQNEDPDKRRIEFED